MDHARLGRTGLQVSRLCLGTMTFGLQSDESTAVAILDHASEGGIDFLDTSDAYPLGGDLSTRGATEEIVGRWLRGKRDRFIVATKCFAPTGPAPFDRGRLAAAAADGLHGSLPAARLRPPDADRRDPGCPGRPRPPGQGPLHRRLELPHLSAGA